MHHVLSSPGRLRALVASIAVLASMAVALTATGTAAASACGDEVLADWFDNGRIDRQYPLRCYREAIDSIPSDIRDYANAEEVIARALQQASSGNGPGGPSDDGGAGPNGPSNPVDPDPDTGADSSKVLDDVDTTSPSSIPIPLLLLAAMSLTLLAAGGLGYLSRRRTAALADDVGDAPTDDDTTV
jgi:hypothetical protein